MKPIYAHLGGALALSFSVAACVPAPDSTPAPTPTPTPTPVQTTPAPPPPAPPAENWIEGFNVLIACRMLVNRRGHALILIFVMY